MKERFPDIIYVSIEGDPDDKYLMARRGTDGFDDGVAVAVYQRIDVREKQITHSLVPRRKRR